MSSARSLSLNLFYFSPVIRSVYPSSPSSLEHPYLLPLLTFHCVPGLSLRFKDIVLSPLFFQSRAIVIRVPHWVIALIFRSNLITLFVLFSIFEWIKTRSLAFLVTQIVFRMRRITLVFTHKASPLVPFLCHFDTSLHSSLTLTHFFNAFPSFLRNSPPLIMSSTLSTQKQIN